MSGGLAKSFLEIQSRICDLFPELFFKEVFNLGFVLFIEIGVSDMNQTQNNDKVGKIRE